jgi:ureidoglycolate hydrolase
MTIPQSLLDVRTHTDAGYLPLVDYGTWRVAILNYSEELRPENINSMQRHNATDEVFVLLRGRCILFVGEGDDDSVGVIHAQPMMPHTVYNVRKAVWHTHTLSPGAMVLVVENRDTTYTNSPFCPLTTMQRQALFKMAADIGWSVS